MNEKKLFLDSVSLLEFYGRNNANIERIKQFFPKIKMVFRGDEIKIAGESDDIKIFENFVERLQIFLDKYNTLDIQNIEQIYRDEKNEFYDNEGVLIFGRSGQPVKPRTEGQKRLLEAYERNDLIFAVGPAGTGKTYLAITLAIRALKNKEVKKIILSRPAVEAGESLGFLPGDMKEKLDPYLQALYDALHDMIPGKKLNEYIEQGIVQIAPLAYMRGRTLSNSVVILDEAQNTTVNQLKMFLTRMGENSKFIVTGDITQIDLPDTKKSGLLKVNSLLKNIKGISFVYFDKNDIIRHKLVAPIIEAFETDDKN